MKSVLAALFAATVSMAGARAQVITWQTPQSITGPSDIATNGSYVDALQTKGNLTDGGTLTALDILNPTTNISTEFNLYTNPGGSSPFYDGTFSITADADSGGDGSGSDATPYQEALDHVTYSAAGTVTMSGLTFGDTYQLQIWEVATYRPTTFTSGDNSVTVTGQYVLGTFTANATTDSFTYAEAGNVDGEINALSLREIPEPSTYLLLLGGIGALSFVMRARYLRA